MKFGDYVLLGVMVDWVMYILYHENHAHVANGDHLECDFSYTPLSLVYALVFADCYRLYSLIGYLQRFFWTCCNFLQYYQRLIIDHQYLHFFVDDLQSSACLRHVYSYAARNLFLLLEL